MARQKQEQKRLILISVDLELQSVILLAMSQSDFQLLEATSLNDVVEQGKDRRSSIILFDLDCTEAEGLEGLKKVRDALPEVPVIVVTHDNSVETGKEIAQQRVFFYSIKPVNIWEISTVTEAAWSSLANRLSHNF